MDFAELRAQAKKNRKAHGVEGGGAKHRMDRPAKRAAGGSIREDFNAAIHDQPARPTVDEPGALPAVHNRADGGRTPSRGWVDGEPRKRGGGNWIAGATKHKGALHRALGVPEGEKIPAKKMAKAAHSENPRIRKEAALAKTLKGMHK